MNFEKIKRLFLQVLIGCLVAAAGIAVVTILAGSFSDVLGKALFTILIIAVHSLLSFSYILTTEKKKSKENLEIFTNATFAIIVFSFMTSFLGIWGVMGGSLVGKLYLTYLVLLFAILHGETLAQTLDNEDYIDNVVYSNFVFMAIVVVMLLALIFYADSVTFTEIYYRFLAAFGIIDATLTLLAIILHKLYLQKHPKVKSPIFVTTQVTLANGQKANVQVAPPKKHMNILVVLLLGFLLLQLVGSLLIALIGAISR